MATALVSSSLPHTEKKTVWFWQSNSNPWGTEEQEWKRYSDFENDYIENAYQRQDCEEVQLNDYVINFKHRRQYNQEDRHKQRRIKREEIDVKSYVREGRFNYPESATQSFVPYEKFGTVTSFVGTWQDQNRRITPRNYEDFLQIAELAAQGILKEGKILNQEFDAQCMADQLRSCIKSQEPYIPKEQYKKYDLTKRTMEDWKRGKTKREIQACAASLYSAESFLFKLLNSTLRNNDYRKLGSLGPFAYLLHRYVPEDSSGNKTVYRGTNLSDEMVNEYKLATGKIIQWLAFTSTSKSRQVAEQFGNVLFIIRVRELGLLHPGIDISSHSPYPHEEEVLLTAGYFFKVEKVEYDSKTKKYLIYMIGNWYQ